MKGTEFNESVDYEDEQGNEMTVVCIGRITEYFPSTMYDRYGDVGSPEEGGEIEFDSAICYMADGTTEDFDGDWDWLEDQIISMN